MGSNRMLMGLLVGLLVGLAGLAGNAAAQERVGAGGVKPTAGIEAPARPASSLNYQRSPVQDSVLAGGNFGNLPGWSGTLPSPCEINPELTGCGGDAGGEEDGGGGGGGEDDGGGGGGGEPPEEARPSGSLIINFAGKQLDGLESDNWWGVGGGGGKLTPRLSATLSMKIDDAIYEGQWTVNLCPIGAREMESCSVSFEKSNTWGGRRVLFQAEMTYEGFPSVAECSSTLSCTGIATWRVMVDGAPFP